MGTGALAAACLLLTDHAADAGAGTVPPGRYRLGRVWPRDNMTLDLQAGAAIHPCRDRADYPALAGSPRSGYRPSTAENPLSCRWAVLHAFGARNVGISARGVVHGEGADSEGAQ